MNSGLTLDTGALIAIEKRRLRALRFLRLAHERLWPITVPAVVVAEWWRGRTDVREAVLEAVIVEPMGRNLARVAGETLAAVRGATTIDAIVMASAAQRGDVVLTGDVGDFERLASRFPGVRVLAV